MAKEYIEREAAKRELLSWAVCMNHPEYLMKDDALHVIDSIPAADAVEVTRCRDCKHRGTDYCIFHIKGEPADEELLRKLNNDFCSYGKREGGSNNG